MNRNVYDTDCVTWSPEGRIFQIEYAAEAIKQGSCVVGLRNNTHAVLCSLRRSVGKLAGVNDKVFKVDNHIGVTFSGITADAQLIIKKMRTDSMHHQYTYNTSIQVERLLMDFSQQSQGNTQDMGKRPFGVGLLVAGVDATGPHIYETSPSGEYTEYYGAAFGSRCQAAKTFIEQRMEHFLNAPLEAVVDCALQALCATATAEQEINGNILHVGVVGVKSPWLEWSASAIDEKLGSLGLKRP